MKLPNISKLSVVSVKNFISNKLLKEVPSLSVKLMQFWVPVHFQYSKLIFSIGFVRFLEGYYMMLVTEAVSIAKIASISYFSENKKSSPPVIDHKLYKINYVSYIPLFDHSTLNVKENKYFFTKLISFLIFPLQDIYNISRHLI